MTALEDIKKALECVTPVQVNLLLESIEGNAIISPTDDYAGTYFTVIGCGDKQDELGKLIALAVNYMPGLVSTLESLQLENAILQERTADYPTISARLHDREKARDAEKKACREAITRAEAAEAEVKRLRQALKPFAEYKTADGYSGTDFLRIKDEHPILFRDLGSSESALTVGDFRRARTALASTGGEHNAE